MENERVAKVLRPGKILITLQILNVFPDFKDQQTHDAPDVLLLYS